MESKGLLFIPDISGFTRFINQTEIEHSRLIIQELLELLINANEAGLEVSEIEGDAILFYKYGEPPELKDLYKQVEKMFCQFHKHIIAYDNRRFCQCKACVSAVELSLKIITHYGEFTSYNVKNFNKLIGKDVIIAHQLLKNDIDKHEYWLVTNSLVNEERPADFEEWMKWDTSTKQTESGEIPFHYTQLSELKSDLSPEFPEFELGDKTKMISLSGEYDTDIITLFHATGDFSFRHRWQVGVKKVEELGHFLPRIGTRSRMIMENGDSVVYASGFTYQPEKIEFSETDEHKRNSFGFLLESINEDKTRLTLNYYIGKNPVRQILFNLFKKKKMKADLQQSLLNLKELIKEISFKYNPS